MTEPADRKQKPFEGVIPEEARTHARAARDELKKTFEAMLPPEVTEHGRQARREMLMAFRSMIDESLKRMDEKKKA
jgi:cytochrome P450